MNRWYLIGAAAAAFALGVTAAQAAPAATQVAGLAKDRAAGGVADDLSAAKSRKVRGSVRGGRDAKGTGGGRGGESGSR